MAKMTSAAGPEQGIAGAAAKLREQIEAAQKAGYRVSMAFQLAHLDSISVSSTEVSEALAAGREPSKAVEVLKDGTTKPIEGKPLVEGKSTGGA